MSRFNYSLNLENYSLKNALLWGNFLGHCEETRHGTLQYRAVQMLIAASLLLPIFSQIGSIFEMIIVLKEYKKLDKKIKTNISAKEIEIEKITIKDLHREASKGLKKLKSLKNEDSQTKELRQQADNQLNQASKLISERIEELEKIIEFIENEDLSCEDYIECNSLRMSQIVLPQD